MSGSARARQRLMHIVHHRNPYSALLGCGPASYNHFMTTPKKTAIITESSGGVGASNRVSTKEDFDWLYCEMTGFMRTQVLAVAASLRLAEQLRDLLVPLRWRRRRRGGSAYPNGNQPAPARHRP